MQIKFEQVPIQRVSSFYGYVNEKNSYDFDMHFHPECELIYFARGYGKAYTLSSVVNYFGGDWFLFAGDVPHTFVSLTKDNRAVVVQFRADMLGEVFWQNRDMAEAGQMLARSSVGLHFQGADIEGGDKKLNSDILKVVKLEGAERLVVLLDILRRLAGVKCGEVMSADITVKSASKCDMLMAALNYIHRHLAGEISLDGVAESVGMSKSGLMKMFKRRTGRTVNDYVVERRIYMACEKLILTKERILDISLDCGFANFANFLRHFKRLKKVTPGELRRAFAKLRDEERNNFNGDGD